MIWFTADHHFGHANVIKFCNRPFADVEEMNEIMVERWNEVVKSSDWVYHLGDFTLGNFEVFKEFALRLNGRILIVPGGHDKRWMNDKKRRPVNKVEILPKLHEIKVGERTIVLCHYPMLSWEKSHYGSLHLHGHSHGKLGVVSRSGDVDLPGLEQGKRIDVGVDCWNFYPFNLEELERFSLLKISLPFSFAERGRLFWFKLSFFPDAASTGWESRPASKANTAARVQSFLRAWRCSAKSCGRSRCQTAGTV